MMDFESLAANQSPTDKLANAIEVDVVVLHPPGSTIPTSVIDAIEGQQEIAVHWYAHEGSAIASDRCRWDTIARARNEACRLGNSKWLMFVDDDVVLGPTTVYDLWAELECSADLGAVAANYSPERREASEAGHVAMGATLFRRELFDQFTFRATHTLCECWCACLDLRELGFEIVYSKSAHATHLRTQSIANKTLERPRSNHLPRISRGIVLAAFDRRDVQRFEHQFLRTLRNSGNDELVIAIGYGLYPSEINRLSRLRNVRIIPKRNNGHMPPVRRLADFYTLSNKLPADQPIAYWDVSDVVFQDSLDDLWMIAAKQPSLIHAVVEPKGYPENRVIAAWSLSILDANWRKHVFSLLQTRPFLNSGFAAGTSSSMKQYFLAAYQYRNGPPLRGSTDWGDQMCLNLYCHSNPERWSPIDERWNYCVHDREPNEIWVTPDGRIECSTNESLSVIHGNARSLRQFALLQPDFNYKK